MTGYKRAIAYRLDRLPELVLPRLVWAALGFTLLAGAIYAARGLGAGWIALGFGIMPDIGLLAGVSRDLEKGRIRPGAVPLYNLLHMFIGPFMMVVLALTSLIGDWGYAAALAWATHVAIDRALGYRLRAPDGSVRS